MDKIPTVRFKSNLEKNGFEIKSLSELLTSELPKDHNPFLPHRLEFFAVIIITAEAGIHVIDFKEYRLTKNDCLVISKGQVHAFDANMKYNGYIVLFTEDFILKHLSQDTAAQVSSLFNYHIYSLKYQIPPQSSVLLNLIQLEQSHTENFLKYKIIASLFGAFLCKLEQYNSNNSKQVLLKGTESNYFLFDKFKNQVERNYQSNRNAKHYASLLSISYKNLNEVSKIFTNKTAKEFIDDFIILEAKRYLCSTSLSAKEIAFKCGFDEQTNFQKYFKKLTGQTPVSFRKDL